MTGPSLDEFVRAHGRSLFGTAYVLCGDRAAAEELVQDTLVALASRWDAVGVARSPLAYARKALVHRFIDQRRSWWSRVQLMAEVPEHPDHVDRHDGSDDRDTLRRLLATLPARQRAALVLRYLYDLPEQEIATILGCRPASVRSLTSRALASLRSELADSDSDARVVPDLEGRDD